MVETWKPIVNFPGYEVSDMGRVGSFVKLGWRRAIDYSAPRRILTPCLINTGYPRVILTDACRNHHHRLVHRLVLEAFVGPCPDGMESCHKNHNRADCRLSNLRWDTRSANQMDRVSNGTDNRGSRHPHGKLTEPQVVAIYRDTRKTRTIAAEYGVSESNICMIKRGKTWSWLTKECV